MLCTVVCNSLTKSVHPKSGKSPIWRRRFVINKPTKMPILQHDVIRNDASASNNNSYFDNLIDFCFYIQLLTFMSCS